MTEKVEGWLEADEMRIKQDKDRLDDEASRRARELTEVESRLRWLRALAKAKGLA